MWKWRSQSNRFKESTYASIWFNRQSKTYQQIKDTLEAIEKLRQHSTIHIIDSDFLTPGGGAELFYKAVEEKI